MIPVGTLQNMARFNPLSGTTTTAFGLLGGYLLGFTDIVRGAFSRSDKSALPDHGVLASFR